VPKLKDESIKYRILISLLEGDKRFNELLKDIKRSTLSHELRELETYHLIERNVDNDYRPPRVTYSITKTGKEYVSAKALEIAKEMELRLRSLLTVIPPNTNHKQWTLLESESHPLAQIIVNGLIARALELAHDKDEKDDSAKIVSKSKK